MRSVQYKKSSLLIFILSFLVISLSAQSVRTFKEVESNSYRFYLEKKWDSLIEYGNLALDSGYDYYYLRLRIGAAYYETGNFRNAAMHYEKAKRFYDDEPYTNESLYDSYLYSGRKEDARLLASRFPDEAKKRLRTAGNKWIRSFYLETGPSFADNTKKYKGINLVGKDSVYGDKDLFGNSFYIHAGLVHQPLPFLTIYQDFGHQDIAVERTVALRIPASYPIRIWDTTAKYNYRQFEYYINAAFNLGWGWSVTPAFHVMQTLAKSFFFIWDSANARYIRDKFSGNFWAHIYSVSLAKEYSLFTFRAFGSVSDLTNDKQYIAGVSATVFPNGNLNCYTTSTFSFFKELNSRKKRLIFDQNVGFRLCKSTWLEANVTLGELTNFVDKNGYIVFNVPDRILFRGGLTILMPLNDHVNLSLRYIYYQKQSRSGYVEHQEYLMRSVNYNNHSLIGGIQWNF